jgi:hypothetical protein
LSSKLWKEQFLGLTQLPGMSSQHYVEQKSGPE